MEIDTDVKIPHVWELIFSRLYEDTEIPSEGVPPEVLELQRASLSEGRVAVFGGNRVGKSTFNKWLLNKILDKVVANSSDEDDPFVLFIDLDPGQAEFTPPGVVSVVKITEHVHGPNYSHLTTPILSKFIGGLDVSACVRTYLRSVKEIFQFLNSEEAYKNVPWVVNTMGFSRGLGVLLANLVIAIMNPTVVVQITLDGVRGEEKRTFPWLLKFEDVRDYVNNSARLGTNRITADNLTPFQFVPIKSVFCDLLEDSRKQVWSVSAKDLRDRVLIQYFAPVTDDTDDNNITAVIPRVVPFSSIILGVMNSDLSYDAILRLINGNLIALCYLEYGGTSTHTNGAETETRRVGSASRFSNNFYGYGIVRSIDRANKLLYIITPVEEEVLVNNVNSIIAAGTIGLPIEVYLHAVGLDEEGHDLPYVMNKKSSKSKLNQATKKQFAPNRVAHTAVINCLL